jgi:hypothetical protein
MSKSYISSFSQRVSDAQPKKACLVSSNAISGSILVFRMGPVLDKLICVKENRLMMAEQHAR